MGWAGVNGLCSGWIGCYLDGGGALSRAIDMLLCICPLIYRSLLESPMGSCAASQRRDKRALSTR